jgi:hypothetical protein
MLAGLSPEHKAKLDLKDATHYKYLTGVKLTLFFLVFGSIEKGFNVGIDEF